jgi:hypothetical protein
MTNQNGAAWTDAQSSRRSKEQLSFAFYLVGLSAGLTLSVGGLLCAFTGYPVSGLVMCLLNFGTFKHFSARLADIGRQEREAATGERTMLFIFNEVDKIESGTARDETRRELIRACITYKLDMRKLDKTFAPQKGKGAAS